MLMGDHIIAAALCSLITTISSVRPSASPHSLPPLPPFMTSAQSPNIETYGASTLPSGDPAVNGNTSKRISGGLLWGTVSNIVRGVRRVRNTHPDAGRHHNQSPVSAPHPPQEVIGTLVDTTTGATHQLPSIHEDTVSASRDIRCETEVHDTQEALKAIVSVTYPQPTLTTAHQFFTSPRAGTILVQRAMPNPHGIHCRVQSVIQRAG